MKWINAKEKKPMHDDIVLCAMWRPEQEDYMHFICTWDKKNKYWQSHWDGYDLEKQCGYKILWWSDIEDPKQ